MAPAESVAPARDPEPREASGITMRLILAYVEREGGRPGVEAVLARAGMSGREKELRDENCWFADSTRVRLFEAAAHVLDDPAVARHIGEAALDLQVGGALKLALRALGSPRTIYSNVPKVNAKFNLVHRMELLSLDSNRARIRNTRLTSNPWSPVDCDYNVGLLSAAPGLFGAPPARVRHPVCVGHGADECVYEIDWASDEGGRAVAAWSLAGLAGLSASALAAPELLPVAGAGVAAAVAATGAIRGRRRRWRALRAQAEQEREAAQRLTLSLQDLVAGLDLDEVLAKITYNARTAVGGTEFALLVQEAGTMRCRSSSGLPPETVAALERWADSTAGLLQAPTVLEDVAEARELVDLPDRHDLPLRSLCAAPLTFREGRLGVLVALAGGTQGFLPRDVDLLQSYAAQAAIALTNARLYATQEARASRDSLTGLLNHREFHETVARELERCHRYGGRMAVALFDLDDFKLVNDTGGHAAGDRVLCDFAAALGRACRSSDLAFRIGGDEFAVVLPEAEAEAAAAAAARVEAESRDIDRRVHVSWGVASWPDAGPTKDALLARADDNLYVAKRADPGELPRDAGATPPAPALNQRARLALVSRVSARLAPLSDPVEIARTAVEELHSSFGWFLVAVLRLHDDGVLRPVAGAGDMHEHLGPGFYTWEQTLDRGVNGRTARTGEPTLVADTSRDPDFLGVDGPMRSRSELSLPIRLGGEVWGVLNLEHTEPHAFGPDDLLFGDTIASALGAALHRSRLFGELESAFMRTLAVLSDALEAKDSYTAEHAREVADVAEAVGTRLRMDDDALRTLRYGALLHDVGKIAISTEILRKPGPLSDEEFEEVKRHTIVGAQMLERIPFFDAVHPLVRSAHERWDGRGYPDGLEGEDAPLGARIVCACDAWHAMTSDRPYRRALDRDAALAELRRHSGTQFDPRVVDALLSVLGAAPARARVP
jgi:diguanylate cyclase (GGDEF)-like protein/putative nucleotidyltransferase with HDIG domain